MRNILFIIFALSIGTIAAQVPASFSYSGSVYNDDGSSLSEQEILVTVRIIEGQDIESSSVYEETHQVTTNNRGSFHLSIGKGIPKESYTDLNDVDWTDSEKFIHIIVYDENNRTINNGISPLMSVPYALVANDVIDSANQRMSADYYVENISELKAICSMSNGDLVYVIGYHNMLDKGGGFFYFQAGNTTGYDDGMIIQPNSDNSCSEPNVEGRWIRINYREVSIAFYGVLPNNPASDYTIQIQKAIDFVANHQGINGGIVFFPRGNYSTKQIILKNGVSLHGEFGGTTIKPHDTANGFALVRLDDQESVKRIEIKNLMFDGEVNGQEKWMHCFSFDSNIGTNTGLWEASFKNIRIIRFRRDGIRFQGGLVYLGQSKSTNEEPSVNQFITMENVRVIKSSVNHDSRALFMHGQNGQFTFTNCTFSGKKYATDYIGTNIEIQGIKGKDVNGPFSAILNFNTCIIEDANLGILINTTQNVNFEGCWFENLNYGIKITQESLGINISKSRFLNAMLESGSWVVRAEDNSIATFRDNLLRGYSTPYWQNSASSLDISGTILD